MARSASSPTAKSSPRAGTSRRSTASSTRRRRSRRSSTPRRLGEALASLLILERSIASSLTSLTSPATQPRHGGRSRWPASEVRLQGRRHPRRSPKKFEEAKKANQHLLMDDCQSLDEVKAKVEDVDLFIPEMPPVVQGARAAGMVAGVAGSLHDVVLTARTSPSASTSGRTCWASGRSRWPAASSRPRRSRSRRGRSRKRSPPPRSGCRSTVAASTAEEPEGRMA